VKGNQRVPIVADICYSLQWYMIVLAACTIIAYCCMEAPAMVCVRLLPVAAAYAAMAVIVRITCPFAIRLLVPVVLVAGCTMMGTRPGEYIIIGAAAFMAVVCGVVMHLKVNMDSSHYFDMIFFCPVFAIASVIMWKAGAHEAVMWINVISVLYLPIGIISWMLVRYSRALAVFNDRPDQPIKMIKRRMNRYIFVIVLAVLLISVMVPQVTGESLLGGIADLFLVLLGGTFIGLSKMLPSCTDTGNEGGGLAENTDPLSGPPSGYLFYYILAGVLLAAIIAALTIALVKLLRRILAGYRNGKGKNLDNATQNDMVEKILSASGLSNDKGSGRNNSAKIRRIYKKRIASILRGNKALRSSMTTAEIESLCRKKGEDVSKLTALYRKARYSKNCTAEDVKEARRT